MTDLQAVLTPVSDSSPCGEDLSFSTEFDAIQEARREDDPALDQGEWVTALKAADWRGAAELCSGLLAARSKDIRLGVWLVEALAKRDGAGGLARGLELLGALCERYWDGLHPLPEAGDEELRIGNLAWLAARIAGFAREFPVTAAPGASYCLNDLESARALQALLERDPDHAAEHAEGRVTLARFNAAQKKTPADFQRALIDDVAAARGALQGLEQVVDTRLGAEGPSFAQARDALAALAQAVEIMARENGVLAGPAHQPSADAPAGQGAGEAHAAAGPIASRAQALQQLRNVAEFFRRTEPHSPVAYLAERAARWGEMPLHLWLRHVVKDEASLGQLEELLGIERTAAPDPDA